MAPMPRPRKPYVQKETSRHGKTVWYFRRGDGPRYRLSGDYESPEWLIDYERALADSAGAAPAPKSQRSTVGWLIERYQDSVAFTRLAPNTRRFRASVLSRVKATAGQMELRHVTRKVIAEGRDRRSATPAAAVNFVKVMHAMFKWAVEAQHMAENPAIGVDRRAPKTDGHHSWTVEEVARFCEKHPIGTMPRLAMDILLFTGMRAGDAVQFGHQHVRDGTVHYRSQKTHVDVELPLLEPLRLSIAAMPSTNMTFLLTSLGRPFKSVNSFGNWFRVQCEGAGVPGRAHGLRKAGATLAANHGASDLQLMAMWGWTTADQATLYTRTANRGKLAQEAGKRLLSAHLENILSPHPAPNVPAPAKKP